MNTLGTRVLEYVHVYTCTTMVEYSSTRVHVYVRTYEIVRGSTTEKGPENAIGGSRRDIQRAIFVKSTGIIRPASEPSCVMQVGVVNYRYDGGGLTLLAPKWNFIVGAFGKCRLRQPYGARFAVAWNWPRRTPIFRSSHNVGVEFATRGANLCCCCRCHCRCRCHRRCRRRCPGEGFNTSAGERRQRVTRVVCVVLSVCCMIFCLPHKQAEQYGPRGPGGPEQRSGVSTLAA